MTNEELAEAVERIVQLDANRAQGECLPLPSEETVADKRFIAAAPLMAAIIAQLWAEREGQRAAMVKAKEAILCMRIGKFFITPRSGEDAIAALESVGV